LRFVGIIVGVLIAVVDWFGSFRC